MDISSTDHMPGFLFFRPVAQVHSIDEASQLQRKPHIRPSVPTFNSLDSGNTKLGEIPLHRWVEPWDFEEMERLNEEAVEKGWPLAAGDGGEFKEEKLGKKRWGLGRFFGRRKALV
ncbi:unnamed protein product [Zymoseptoria tritici ST99CH_3D1]|nr:unnamed protein product [Zymoseptoria tritici ST99CH_3D1]